MDYKEKVIALLNSQELSKEQKEKLEDIFPELTESEDERIRKDIIILVKDWWDRVAKDNISTKEQMLTWLEKQGEIIKEWGDLKVRYIQDDLQEMVDLKQKTEQGEQKPNKCMYSNDNYTDEERKVLCDGCDEDCKLKQKPADKSKIKPKFKTGDRVVGVVSGMPYFITEVCDDHYNTESGCIIMFSAQNNFELSKQEPAWSEEDEEQARQIERIVHNEGYTQKLQNQIADWFKSLKDRYTWKPSDEQIKALTHLFEGHLVNAKLIPKDYDNLKLLLEQLKKLKG